MAKATFDGCPVGGALRRVAPEGEDVIDTMRLHVPNRFGQLGLRRAGAHQVRHCGQPKPFLELDRQVCRAFARRACRPARNGDEPRLDRPEALHCPKQGLAPRFVLRREELE